jgi:(E)-4-hydroxy-3-methyl-but-2-enyl pyrophosphate reductase
MVVCNLLNIKVAKNAGFCFGVERAIEEAEKVKKNYDKRIYTLGPLIHNKDAVEYLKSQDIYPIEITNLDNLKENDVIIIRSHGVTESIYTQLVKKNLVIVDATCPYVSNIQKKVRKYFNLGYNIIIVGDASHPEVIGINGWCDNSAIISKDGTNLIYLPKKVCVVSQTTERQDNWEKVLNKLVNECKEILAFNTICNATEVRQKAAEKLSKEVDAMVIIGGYNSSNTTKLYELCIKNCNQTIHVENAGEIPDFILNSNSIKTIGVTAGASTPDWIIKEAILKMKDEKNLEINEQLAFMEENDKRITVGEVINGEVISLNDNEAFLNIRYKADAMLPKEEVTRDSNVKLTNLFSVGQIVEVKVVSLRNEDGYVVVSRTELERQYAYKILKEAVENKDVIEVNIREAVNGGLLANYKGAKVFIPASHVELHHVGELASYIGKDLSVNIIEFKEERRNLRIVGSRRDILKATKNQQVEETWSKLEKDVVVEGEVRRLTDFGAFVDINGVDGLLHVSEISWGRINKPADALHVGDKITVKVIAIDKEAKKISLSRKALAEDPWNDVDVKYPSGNIVLGKVVRFADFGAFVELEPGVDGLVHVSEISNKRINKPGDVLEIGQQVKSKILEVNMENKKIGLSIKAVEEI